MTAQPHCARVEGVCNRCDKPVPFEFTMAFQPIVDVALRKVVYYEALVRGLDGASAYSILRQVTSDMLYRFDQACRVKAIELASDLDMQERLSINFLPNAVYEPEACLQSTLATSQRLGFPAERLNFEITETERVVDRAHLRSIIDGYRRMGFTTSLDDFGNGYANLDLLTDLRPDTLKIDRELVMDCDSSTRRQAILKSLVSLAHTLDIQLVAEGVETRNESRCMLALGISVQQGYYFARPQINELPRVALAQYD